MVVGVQWLPGSGHNGSFVCCRSGRPYWRMCLGTRQMRTREASGAIATRPHGALRRNSQLFAQSAVSTWQSDVAVVARAGELRFEMQNPSWMSVRDVLVSAVRPALHACCAARHTIGHLRAAHSNEERPNFYPEADQGSQRLDNVRHASSYWLSVSRCMSGMRLY